VARQLGTSLPSVTALVDGVVAKGLVERTIDDGDRRRVFLSMTELGRTTLTEADRVAEARLVELAAFLDEGEAEAAFTGLQLWAVALDREAGLTPTTSR
jgi:long-chain acyl-CoA synthetase